MNHKYVYSGLLFLALLALLISFQNCSKDGFKSAPNMSSNSSDQNPSPAPETTSNSAETAKLVSVAASCRLFSGTPTYPLVSLCVDFERVVDGRTQCENAKAHYSMSGHAWIEGDYFHAQCLAQPAVSAAIGKCFVKTFGNSRAIISYYEQSFTVGSARSDCNVRHGTWIESHPPAADVKMIYLTSSLYTTRGFGSVNGADSKCMLDPAKPKNVVSVKALIADGTHRRACTSDKCEAGGTSEHIDWVFSPNTTYYHTDGSTPIGTTDANGIMNFEGKGINGTFWSGLTGNWNSAGHCNAWTSSSRDDKPYFSSLNSQSGTSLLSSQNSSFGCDIKLKLACVTQ